MAASDHARVRRVAVTMAVLCAAALVACSGEFARNNPFDPAVPVELHIEGPDKTVAQFDTVHFTLVTEPDFDHGPVEWTASRELEKLDENGTFRAPRVFGVGGFVDITARTAARTATKRITISYQPASFRVHNCADTTSRTIELAALDTTAFVCATVYDARGGILDPAYGFQPIPLVTRSLDTSVVTTESPSGTNAVRSVGNGTTQVVYSFNGVPDTMTVVVHQRVAYFTRTPTTCSDYSITMPVGSTMQLTVGTPAFDVTGHPVTDPAEIQAALASVSWASVNGNVSVTPAGLVTAKNQGFDTVVYYLTSAQNFVPYGPCFVTVTP